MLIQRRCLVAPESLTLFPVAGRLGSKIGSYCFTSPKAIQQVTQGPKFGPGFTEEEAGTIQSTIARTGLDYTGRTFWRGEGAPANTFASGSPGNITVYDSFFRASSERQLYILREEFQHTLQLITSYSNAAVTAAEEAAKRFAGGGGQ